MDLLQMTLESIAAIPADVLLWLARAGAMVIALLALIASLADQRYDAVMLRQTVLEQQKNLCPQLADMQKRIAALGAALTALAVQRDAQTEPLMRATQRRVAAGHAAAIRLARSGASVAQVMDVGGTSLPEAELLCSVYGTSNGANKGAL